MKKLEWKEANLLDFEGEETTFDLWRKFEVLLFPESRVKHDLKQNRWAYHLKGRERCRRAVVNAQMCWEITQDTGTWHACTQDNYNYYTCQQLNSSIDNQFNSMFVLQELFLTFQLGKWHELWILLWLDGMKEKLTWIVTTKQCSCWEMLTWGVKCTSKTENAKVMEELWIHHDNYWLCMSWYYWNLHVVVLLHVVCDSGNVTRLVIVRSFSKRGSIVDVML